MSGTTIQNGVAGDIPKHVLMIQPFQRFFRRIVRGSFPLFFTTILTLVLACHNAGLHFEGIDVFHAIGHPVTLGIVFGLVVGKPIGIPLFTYLTQGILKMLLASGVDWGHIVGASMLGGKSIQNSASFWGP